MRVTELEALKVLESKGYTVIKPATKRDAVRLWETALNYYNDDFELGLNERSAAEYINKAIEAYTP